MPIVDISGLSPDEKKAKRSIRIRIQKLYRDYLGMEPSDTSVTFITDETAVTGREAHVMARLYSKKFMTMPQDQLEKICDSVRDILEEEAGHSYNEAFPVPVMAMRGRQNPRYTG
jgi:hypothetical protein